MGSIGGNRQLSTFGEYDGTSDRSAGINRLRQEIMNRLSGGSSTEDFKNMNPAQLFAMLVRRSYDDSEEYRRAKEYLINNGRGLGDPNKELTAEAREVLRIAEEKSILMPISTTLYRTDTTNWLSNFKEGDTVKIDTILQTSLDKSLVIPENRGNVRQRMVIETPARTRVFVENNAVEQQVDIVRNQSYTILRKQIEDGVPTYYVRINH